MTAGSDEIPLLILIDPTQRNLFLQRVRDIRNLGATILETIPQFGIIVVCFSADRMGELRNVEGVVSVERSRRLTY